jgi:hypothetical protein
MKSLPTLLLSGCALLALHLPAQAADDPATGAFGDRQAGRFGNEREGYFGNPADGNFDTTKIKPVTRPGEAPARRMVPQPLIVLDQPMEAVNPPPAASPVKKPRKNKKKR